MQNPIANLTPSRRTALISAVLALLYVSWAYPFMTESSVVAMDGHRYFNLFDDAMISMRYAWNFSHGQGLVWNPGERVEGYTNLLLTLVMSVFTGLLDKSAAVLAVQIMGIGLVLGCVYLVWKLATELAAHLDPRARPFFVATVVVLTITYYPLSFWALTGMETGLLTFLVLAAVYVVERDNAGSGEAHTLQAAGLLGLAYLTRPDSIIFAVPLLAYTLEKERRENDGTGLSGRVALGAIGLYLAFPLLQEAFRIIYYGATLPNTYYLKLTGMPLANRLQNGMGFLRLYLVTHAFFLGFACLACILKPARRRWTYLSLVLLPIVYQAWIGGDPVSVWRIMAPVEPLAAVLFALAAIEPLQRGKARVSTMRGVSLVAAATAIGILSVNLIFAPQILLHQPWFPGNFYAPRTNAAIALSQITTPEASVGVFAAGVIPYYTGLRASDFLGRTDTYIASLPADLSGAVSWNGMYSVPGHNKYDLIYSIEELEPTYIEASRWGGQDVTTWVSTRYVQVEYRGVTLLLKRDAAEINWELLPSR